MLPYIMFHCRTITSPEVIVAPAMHHTQKYLTQKSQYEHAKSVNVKGREMVTFSLPSWLPITGH